MQENIFFLILADIDDLIGILVVVAFAVISVVGNIIKAASQKKEKEGQTDAAAKISPQKATSPPRPVGRAQRLPYAKAAPSGAASKPKTTLEKLEELKQRRLEQIRQQQLDQQQSLKQPEVQRPSPVPPFQSRSLRPAPVRPSVKPFIKAEPVPVAQPVRSIVTPVHKQDIKTQKKSASEPSFSHLQRNVITMLRDKKMIRNAILASEILGKPVSLR